MPDHTTVPQKQTKSFRRQDIHRYPYFFFFFCDSTRGKKKTTPGMFVISFFVAPRFFSLTH
jgi:hypothetical protein